MAASATTGSAQSPNQNRPHGILSVAMSVASVEFENPGMSYFTIYVNGTIWCENPQGPEEGPLLQASPGWQSQDEYALFQLYPMGVQPRAFESPSSNPFPSIPFT